MFCRNCGKQVPDNLKFCGYCGAELTPSNGQGQNYVNSGAQAYGQQYAAQPTATVKSYNLISAYTEMFKKYAQFEGRSRRQEYWLASLANFIIMMIVYIFMFATVFDKMATIEEASVGEVFGSMGVFIALIGIYALVVMVPSLALGVRRLHDTGRSGWYMLLSLVPYVGGIILLVFYASDSQPGANQYGENPKGL